MGLHPTQIDLGAKFILINEAGGDWGSYPPKGSDKIEKAYQKLIERDGDVYTDDLGYFIEALSNQYHEDHKSLIEELEEEVPFILSL